MQMKNQRMSLMPKGKQKMRRTDSEYEEFLEIINSSIELFYFVILPAFLFLYGPIQKSEDNRLSNVVNEDSDSENMFEDALGK